MSSFATRLNQFIDYLRLSKRAFEENCSIAQGNVSHCIKKDTTLSSKNIVKISKRYSELNTDWLINDRGNMLISKNLDTINYNVEGVNQEKDWKEKRIEDLEEQLKEWKEIVQLLKHALNMKDK